MSEMHQNHSNFNAFFGSLQPWYKTRQPWGLHYGVTAGGGFAFDSAGPVGVFVEVPWTYVINQVPYEKGSQLIQDVPERPGNSNQVVGIKLGMALRFH